nr:DUF1998 domain-containing protein [Calditrichia bacterium]
PSLAAMPGVFEQYWSRRLDGNAYLSTFFPPDLHYREDYGYLRQHGKLPRGSELPELLRQRLSWEVNSEYGYRARVGRTLEKSGASIALPDPQRLQKALENLLPMLREEIGGLRELDQTALARLIGGFIAQLRVKGGVFHPGLESYIREGANTFMLRRVPYMPPFAPGGRTPVFLSQIPFGYERFDVLLRAGSVTWHSQWAVKNLLPFGQQFDPFMGDIYRLLLRELVAREILQEETVHGVSVWGLRGEALQLTTAVRQLRCDTCGHDMSAATGEDHWVGMPCLRFNCRGHYQAEPSGEDYYRRLYSTGDIQRIFAEEHTGLLGREEREELEQHFEQQNHPWDPNLLSCTPTLEMGVDIGALSSLVLCSVPPRQANYLQRIGRAGRRDGNSFILTVANGDPHDLYFYQQPEEMMAGAVEPPGVFLNAPAVLERQFIAFTFERFILAGVPTPALPAKIRPVLNRWEKEEPGNFPYNWLAFCESSQGILLTDFFNLFQDALDETARKHLSQFVKTDRREGLQSSIKAAFADAAEEIRVHRQRVQQLNRKIREMENSPVRDQNYDANLNELKREKQALNGIINKIADKDLFSFLSEEGLLPNYAFPEPGVQLRSVIYRKKRRADAEGAYQVSVYEYERPGASAIRELAPENQFYAGGRRVSVDQINLQLSPEEFWRFCDNCSHMARDLGGEVSPTCPTCGSERWSDHNQVRSLIRMKQVMANTSDRESRIGDDSDDRSPAHYHNHLVVEIGRDKVASAFHIPGDQVPFGFEYISRFTLREINFGHREQAGNPIRIAGQDTGINGFQVCRACGKVRKAGDAEGRWHAFGCRYRGLTDDDSTLSGFYLYREFQSEALRILAPALLREDSGSVVNSLRAALFLGLREHFRGDIEHLQIAQQFEPYDGPDFQRHYLVLYDRVPGGTGYLKELMRDNYPLLDVLQKGLDKLKACPRCSRADGPDGCYQCIYAYRFSRDMANISRQSAINLLTEILRNRHQVGPIETVDTISLNNLLESELEKRFVDGLARLALEKDNIRLEKEIVNGKHGWRLQVGESVYRMEPQVNLGPEQGVSERCRADFVLYPIKQTPGKPVVLFTDGFAYHAGETQLNRRLGADMRQRMAIVDSKAFRVWSLTWQDLEKLETRHPEHFENLLKSPPHQLFQVYSNQPGRQEHQRLLQLGSMDLLIAHLEKPQAGYWLAVAHLAVLGMVVAEGLVNISKDTYRKALQEAVAAPLDEQKLDVPLAEEGGTLLGCRWVFSGEQEGATVLFMVISQNDDIVTSGGKGIRLLVRLLDEKPMPREKFRRLWNGYLQAFNLLQFLPGARFLASEGLRSAGDPVVDEWLFAEIEPQQDAPQIEPAWAEILAVSEPAWQGAIEQLSGMSVPLPICGYELMNTGGAVCAQAFLAWENDMIAILAPDEMDGKHLFEEAGWQVFAIDALVRDPAMLSGLFK